MRRTLAALAMTLGLSGCSAEKAGIMDVDGTTGCTADYQCPQGTTCDTGSRTCVVIDTVQVDLLVEIEPLDPGGGPGMSPAHHVLLSGRLDDLATDIVLAPTARVGGLVSRHDGSYVEARVELAPRLSGFPGSLRKAQSVATSENDVPGLDNWAVELLPGEYDVTVSPRGADAASLPPLYPGTLTVESAGELPFDVQYPLDFTTLAGTLLLASDDPVPHSLEVWAVDASSGKRVSTISGTGQPVAGGPCAGVHGMGRFCMVLTPGAASVKLKVAPGEDSAQAAAYPYTTLGEWDLAGLDADADRVIDLDLESAVPARLPALGDLVLYKAKVEGISPTGVTQPVTGVSLNFTAERDGASFDVYSITNSAGEICQTGSDGELVWGVMLRENDYEVTIIPPLSDVYESMVLSSLTVSYTTDGVIMGQVYQLGAKRPFVGKVERMFTGEPVEGLTVEAFPMNSVDLGGQTFPLPRYGSGQTGLDGRLRLELDRGVYDVLIRSSMTDQVPWIWLADRMPDNESADLVIRAPEPVLLTGTVMTSDIEPAANALVSIYQVVYSPDPDEPPATRLVWETTVTSEGGFVVLLSP